MTDDATTPGLADQVLELLRAGRDDDLWALFDRSFQETVSRADVEQARTSMEEMDGFAPRVIQLDDLNRVVTEVAT